jgi:beta-glucanase (GH16 family)
LGSSYPERRGWPECGEIDVAEWGSKIAVDSDTLNTQVLSAVHFELFEVHQNEWSTFVLDPTTEQDFVDAFHVYRLDWTPDYVRMFVDDRLIFAKDISTCEMVNEDCTELHEPHYLILNVAVGGVFTGIYDPTSPGGEMLVDWVRAYESTDTTSNGTALLGPPVTFTPCDGPCPINEDRGSGGTTTRTMTWTGNSIGSVTMFSFCLTTLFSLWSA